MNRTTKLITGITFLMMIAANALANILPINQMTTGAISDAYPNLFAPAGYTFLIWGVIYLLLGLFVIKALTYPKAYSDTRHGIELNKICLLLSFSNVANTLWILSWHYLKIGLSLALMFSILVLLIMIALKIKHNDFSKSENWWIKLPMSVYYGWITIAAIANVVTYLVSVGWSGFGLSDEIWMVAVLLVGVIICSITMIRIRSVEYGLVAIWAYTGILVKHLSATGYAGTYALTIAVLYTCVVLLALATLYSIRQLFKT